MKITLLQMQQNRLHDFSDKTRCFNIDECKILQEEMLQQNIQMIQQLSPGDTDLIVTSEAINYCGAPWNVNGDFLSLIPDAGDAIFSALAVQARRLGTYIVAGLYRKEKINGEWAIMNSAIVFNRMGEIVAVYDKTHLAGDENDYLTPGNRIFTIKADFGNMGICICWDAQFPEVTRTLALQGVDLVVCPTWGWESLYGRANAYLNGIFVAATMAVPYQGIIEGIRIPSEIIAPWGEILTQVPPKSQGFVHVEIDLSAAKKYRELRLGGRRPELYY